MSNEDIYTRLLDYLDQVDIKSAQVPTRKKGIQETELKKVPTSKKIKYSVEDVSEKTKKFLEESKEKKEIIVGGESVGFDVKRFESIMRNRLIEGYKKTQSYERPNITVLELLSCMRKNYYARMHYTVDVKELFKFAYLDIINEVANSIHDYIQELYGFEETQKTIVSEKYKVKGRLDAYKNGYLYEIKTIEEDKFFGNYLSDHYNQGLVYAYILNTEYSYKVHTVTIIYVMRNNVRKIVPFDIKVNNEEAKKFLERAPRLLSHISRKVVPDPIAATHEQCDFCPYMKYCKEDTSRIEKPFEVNKYEKYEKEIDKHVPKKPVFLF
jgi:hypothetical protein